MKLFLSHKYGNNLLPSKFTEQELSKFKEESKTILVDDLKLDSKIFDNCGDLFDYFYRLNKNEKPYAYKLIEIDRIVKEINMKVNIVSK